MDALHLLPNNGRAAAEARHIVDDLRTPLAPTRETDIRLVVTEMVTNAVKHSGAPPDQPIELHVRAGPRALRLEVRDRGRGFPDGFRPLPDPPDEPVESGIGLYLVSRVSDRWGMESNDTTRVWAEFDLEPAR